MRTPRRPTALAAAGLALGLTLAALLLLGSPAGAGAKPKRERFDTRVLAVVPFPGYPARAYVHPNGRIYAGTYESSAGADVPSRLFEYTRRGELLRSWTIAGQKLGSEHGIQAAISDSRGRMVLLDTDPARVLTLNLRKGKQRTYAKIPDIPACSGAGDRPLLATAPRRRADPQLRGVGPRRQPVRDRLRAGVHLACAAGRRQAEAVADLAQAGRNRVRHDRDLSSRPTATR